MKNIFVFLGIFCLSFLLSCGSSQVEVVQFTAIENLINSESENVQVINFWATWCGPCVKELPSFEKANEKFAEKGVNFTLVSIDFVEDLEKKVIPFAKKKGLKSSVLLLDNTDYDSWIHKVSEDWDGAIPATLIVNSKKGTKELLVGELTYEELEKAISESL
ncbi:MAG: thiol-disulfide isomerase/thioredoxin [Flammeovirgaceae bacterium]|jgi:thiol-disulfide isomerase/thioredoxin